MNSRAASPKVWVLLGQKAGDNVQLTSLAEALGWPYETKVVGYNWLNRCPNLLLGASLISLNRRTSDPLTAPWPDVVIAASRRSAPIACWIKKQSGGQTRLVHLLHAQAPLDLFDLVITPPQYCLPDRPNVLHITAPLNRIASDRLTAAAVHWEPRLSHLPRPFTALLVGGNSETYELDRVTAADLGRQASAQVRISGGTLLVSTSPRTPVAAVDALFVALDCPAYCYRWSPQDPDNPYLAYLALADGFIVTVDSASQIVEACAMDKPVHIFEWPAKTLRFRVKGALQREFERYVNHPNGRGAPEHQAGLTRLYQRLVYWGFIRPTRDFETYLQGLKARGLITRLGETATSSSRQPLNDIERAVVRIRHLLDVGA